MRRIMNIFFLFLIPLFLMCSGQGINPADEGDGSLVISLNNQVKTILPDISMDIASYRVSGSGPDGAVLIEQTFDADRGQYTLTGLASGTWTITVDGFNSSGTAIGTGTGSATVYAGVNTPLPITLSPFTGNGSMSITATWSETLTVPSVTATLTSSAGQTVAVAVTPGSGSVVCSNASLAAGYYTLSLQLFDNGTQKGGLAESVRIVQGETTSPSIPFTMGSSGLKYVADYTVAKDSVLRSIPDAYINAARTTLRIAYFHTSHGTHVSFGLFGLPGFKSGDDVKFGITNNSTRDADKLDFHDYGYEISVSPYSDLSGADANWTNWMNQVRTYLDNSANSGINVMMWSWCDISGHNVANYLSSMQTLINEYGPGGTKIGTGSGQRTTPVTFIFMTGHATANSNTGSGRPKEQAQLIIDYCNTHSYYCIDYYSIDTHTMNDVYYEDTGDNGDSTTYGGNFYRDWQSSHISGTDWYYNLRSPGGTIKCGEHNDQHITANRKAFAAWYVFARIAGWQ